MGKPTLIVRLRERENFRRIPIRVYIFIKVTLSSVSVVSNSCRIYFFAQTTTFIKLRTYARRYSRCLFARVERPRSSEFLKFLFGFCLRVSGRRDFWTILLNFLLRAEMGPHRRKRVKRERYEMEKRGTIRRRSIARGSFMSFVLFIRRIYQKAYVLRHNMEIQRRPLFFSRFAYTSISFFAIWKI